MISARPNERTLMGKRHRIIKKPQDGAIEVTARLNCNFKLYSSALGITFIIL